MINNMKGKTYEIKLHWLKLCTLKERRNRQDLIEVYKVCAMELLFVTEL